MLKNYTKEDEYSLTVYVRERETNKKILCLFFYEQPKWFVFMCLFIHRSFVLQCPADSFSVCIKSIHIRSISGSIYLYAWGENRFFLSVRSERTLGQNFVFISAENRLCLVWILFYSLVRTNVSLCTQLTVDNGSLSTDYQNILVEQSL